MTVTSAAGPFRVTSVGQTLSPTVLAAAATVSPTIWISGTQQTISWDVANTTAAPVSCDQVDILFSRDGGQIFSSVLVSKTANDGSETITVPNVGPAAGVVKVQCSNNIFFDLSKGSLLACESLLKDDHEDGFADWTVSNDTNRNTNDWQGKTDGGLSGNNYWFVASNSTIFNSDSYLDSPQITAANDYVLLSFFHKYDLEGRGSTFLDGGVVEISVKGGTYQDVGQDKFLKNGYNGMIQTDTNSPIAGRLAFSGNSGPNYIESVVNLSSLVNKGDTFKLRFREANDLAAFPPPPEPVGWFVDDVLICSGPNKLDDVTTSPSSSNINLPLILK
jgi:hypothetical protein